MNTCNKCHAVMVGVKSFSPKRKIKYYQCPKCKSVIGCEEIPDSDLNFRERIYRK